MLVTCISISTALSNAIYLEILGINLLMHCKNATQFFPLFETKVITILFVLCFRRQWVSGEIHFSEHLAAVQCMHR